MSFFCYLCGRFETNMEKNVFCVLLKQRVDNWFVMHRILQTNSNWRPFTCRLWRRDHGYHGMFHRWIMRAKFAFKIKDSIISRNIRFYCILGRRRTRVRWIYAKTHCYQIKKLLQTHIRRIGTSRVTFLL